MLNTFLFYLQQLLVVSISAFVSLVCLPVGITRSAVEIKFFAIIAGFNRYKSIIKKNNKKHDKSVVRKR